MRKISLVVGALILGYLLGAGVTTPPAPADPPAARTEPARCRRNAARQVYGQALQLYSEGLQLDAERVYLWSCRWLDAERGLGTQKADHVAALTAHRDRMTALHEMARRHGGLVAPMEVTATDYYRAEAEEWLAAAQRK
jgi:hypothetical protein